MLHFWHYAGNKALTLLSNMATNLNLTDMESGYKMFQRETVAKIQIEENRFGFEPEIVTKVSRMGLRIYEVSISYYGHTYVEGNKIGRRDGFSTLRCIIKYKFLRCFAPPAPFHGRVQALHRRRLAPPALCTISN